VDPSTVRDDAFYLQMSEKGSLQLSRDHDYYYQVQGQLGVCKPNYCDFVCWTTKGIHVEWIVEDTLFFKALLPKLENFFVKYIFPEVLSRKLLDVQQNSDEDMEQNSGVEENNDTEIFCICQQGEFGKMIACDNPECKTEWFHYPCVGLAEDYEPNEWYCRDCAAKQ